MLQILEQGKAHYYILMFKIKENKKELRIELSPNNSSSLSENLLFFGILSLLCIGFGIGFFFVGATMILPFAGVEVAVLLSAIYYNRRWISQKQIIKLDKLYVHFSEKGIVSRSMKVDRFHAKFLVEKSPKQSIYLVANRKKFKLGYFLNDDEIKDIILSLRSKITEFNSI